MKFAKRPRAARKEWRGRRRRRRPLFRVMPPKTTKKSHGLTVKFTGVEEKVEGEKKYNVYTLAVQKEGDAWTLQKRYSDFLFFQTHLDKKIYGAIAAPFPEKKLGQLTPEQMDTRQQELRAWFDAFLAMPITPRVLQQTYSFLRVAEHVTDAGGKEAVRKETGSIIKMGYMKKLGGNKKGGDGNYRRRFMVLSDNLSYYADEETYQNGGAPKGKISMNAIYCPTPAPSEDHQFTLYALPYEFTCKADTKEDMDDWVSLFRNIQAV